MNKETYLAKVAEHIKKLPKSEQVEILMDYEEHFESAELNGRSQEEIIRKLGDPQTVGREILVQYKIAKAQDNPSLNNLTKAVFAVLGLGIINLLFALAPFVLGLAILAGIFVLSAYLLASPILLLIQDGFTLTLAMEIPTAVGLVGLGLLVLLGALKLTVLYYRWMIAYLNFNRKWVRERSK